MNTNDNTLTHLYQMQWNTRPWLAAFDSWLKYSVFNFGRICVHANTMGNIHTSRELCIIVASTKGNFKCHNVVVALCYVYLLFVVMHHLMRRYIIIGLLFVYSFPYSIAYIFPILFQYYNCTTQFCPCNTQIKRF